MRIAQVLVAVAALAAASPFATRAVAQGLDQLPKPVADEVRAAERECRTEWRSDADYAPFELVRTFYMGAVGAGQEAFLIDFAKFRCRLPEDAQNSPEVLCGSYGCRTALFLPVRRGRWAKVYDEHVLEWSLEAANRNVTGPNVRLRLVTAGGQCGKHRADECNLVFRAEGGKLVRTR